jgi:hypothetical protein
VAVPPGPLRKAISLSPLSPAGQSSFAGEGPASSGGDGQCRVAVSPTKTSGGASKATDFGAGTTAPDQVARQRGKQDPGQERNLAQGSPEPQRSTDQDKGGRAEREDQQSFRRADQRGASI